MSCVEQMAARAEELLAAGVDDQREILAQVVDLVDLDYEVMRWEIARKRLSLALATIVDADGNRLAFPHKIDGRRVVLHLDYNKNIRAMLDLAAHKRTHAQQEIHQAARLEERALQLTLPMELK